jgi:hypothetical protein
MKSIVILALAVLALGQVAEAQRHGGGRGRGGHRGPDHRRPHYPRTGCTDIFGNWTPCNTGVIYTETITCAPKVVANNLQTADAVLGSLATGELKSNATFTAKVSAVASIESAQDKSAAYLALAGVDANNAEEVLNFIYAREASASNVLAAQKSLDLNADQATLVINKLTSALKPLN